MGWLVRRGLSMAFAASVALSSTIAFAAPDDSPFCVLPVLDGAPTEADIGATWRITFTTFHIPGLPGPVFAPLNRGGRWTIDRGRRLVSYLDAFPANPHDKWIKEPWSGRVVGVPSLKGSPFVLDPGDRTFERIHSGDSRDLGFRGPFTLPRRRQTVVIASPTSEVLAIEDRSLRLWISPQEMKMAGLHSIGRLHDAPSLSATIVLGSTLGERKYGVHVLADDNSWHHVVSLGEDDFHRKVVDAPGSGVTLLITAKTVFAIRNNGPDASPWFSAERLQHSTTTNVISDYHVSELFGQVLAFAPRARWTRLVSAGGFEDIPGGDIGPMPDLSAYLPQGRIQDLPTLGRTLIEGRDGLFLYDGTRIVAVTDSSPNHIGQLPRAYDLPSIGRVVVTTRRGLFELDREGRLQPRPMPFATDGWSGPSFIDWPSAGVALANTTGGLFVLDRDLDASAVPGGDQVELEANWDVNRATSEIILIGKRGLFLAVDGRRGGSRACRALLEKRARIPYSDMCLNAVPELDARSISFPLDGTAKAPFIPLPPSLHGRGHVLAALNLGSTEVLFATTAGLFAADNRGNARQLGSTADLRIVRTLAIEAGSGHVLAGGDGGLFRIKVGSQDVEPVENGTNETIGAVTRIVDASFARINVIEASNGTYALENGKLSIIRDLAAASRLSSVHAFPHLQRLLTMRRRDQGPLLYEVGRRDSTGVCSRPINHQ